MESDDTQETDSTSELPGLAIDLSAGGIKFLARVKIESGSEIRVLLPPELTRDPEIWLGARIKRARARDDAGTTIYGAEWIELEHGIRESIVSYVQDIHRTRPRA